MLQRILQTCRLQVTALEERATPAAGFPVTPAQPPVMFVVGNLPTAPPASDVAAKPIVRLDITADGGSANVPTQDWSEMMAGAPKAPPQETGSPAPTGAANAQELALLEAEWTAMQQADWNV